MTPDAWTKIGGGAVAGVILGYLGADVLFVGSGLSLIPWGLVALAIGFWIHPRQLALVTGLVYGFALAYSFMAFGYDGAASLASRTLPFAVLGVIGGLCGALLVLVGGALSGRRRSDP